MTKSTITITRERAQQIFLGNGPEPSASEERELARMALAAMDSEPVAWLWSRDGDDERDVSLTPPDDDDDASDAIECGWTATPLYRHAQQPVVPEKATVGEMPFLGTSEGAYVRGWNDCRAAILQESQKSAGESNNCRSCENVQDLQAGNSPAQGGSRCSIKAAPALDSSPKTAESRCGNSPVVPDGYVMVPMRLTAENGAKGALSGEFSETKFVNCPECFGDDECETCDGSGRIEITVPVTWTTIKEIWAKGVEHFAAAPQEVKGE
ncbi:hypothetical protein ABN154_22995 [Klebsiella michiganensis]|uniref:hypothetical protein n=1 Tax=Klebsiella michiganensis TaxID=1134687 RepID=UPI0032DAF2D0